MDDVLNKQLERWESAYSEEPTLYGEHPSFAAEAAAREFKLRGIREIVELGCGHGRDSIFFAQSGFKVHALDYSRAAIDTLASRAQLLGHSNSLSPLRHDLRTPLPFGSETIGGSYSHMLYSMAFTFTELQSLSKEVHRILRPQGLNILTVRTKEDGHYGRGTSRGEGLYENDGFIVRFFDTESLRPFTEDYDVITIEKFQEGELPRKLFLVVLRKRSR